jgi:hypothetical protein
MDPWLLPHYGEPIEAWRRLVRDVRGCLTIAARFHLDERVAPEDWELFATIRAKELLGAPKTKTRWAEITSLLVPRSPEAWLVDSSVLEFDLDDPGTEFEEIATTPTGAIARLIDMMMRPVSLHLAWNGTPRVELQPTGVLGALGVQLAQGCVLGRSFALCSSCGRLFRPKRKPRSGEATWCSQPKCKRASQRAAEERYRLRGHATEKGKKHG